MTEDQGRFFFWCNHVQLLNWPGARWPAGGRQSWLGRRRTSMQEPRGGPGRQDLTPAFLGEKPGKVWENRGTPMINDDKWRLIAGKILKKEELIMEKYENVRCNRCQWRSIAWRHPKIEDFLASHVWLPEGTGHLYFHPCFVMKATVYCNSSFGA